MFKFNHLIIIAVVD